MDKSEPLVSVVVPVYNEEKYLAECIKSVLDQSYSNWQLTVINNGSTDRSLEIAEQYARLDSRIRHLTTPEFYPQLRNLNYTLRQVSPESKYCKMVLGDNWIFPDCLRLMVNAAEANPSIGIVSGLWITSTSVIRNSLPYPSLFLSGRDICRRQLMSDEDYFGSPTMNLYRSQIVRDRDPFFRETARSADVEACYEILQKWDFSFIHQVLSFNRTDNMSIGSTGRAYGCYAMTQLMQTKRYGDIFLDPAERENVLRRWEHSYYGFLAERAVLRPGRAFWDYHRAALATCDQRLEWRLLTKYMFFECADLILNPKKTLGRILKALRASNEVATESEMPRAPAI